MEGAGQLHRAGTLRGSGIRSGDHAGGDATPPPRRRPLETLRALFARSAGAIGVRRPELPAGEVNAAACLELFLCAALGPHVPATTCLATALFALGALDAAADRAGLGRASRQRLEARFLEAFYGTGGRETEAWRCALHDFERTRSGWAIRGCGEAALDAWLRGEPPAPYLARVLASSPAS